MNLSLTRTQFREDGIFGIIKDETGKQIAVTLERNFDGKPKIPAGTYLCTRRMSPRFNCELFQVMNVSGHDYIEIHPANWEFELDGCIAVGEQIQPSSKGQMITCSREAFGSLMELQDGVQEFTLTISDS